MNYLLQRGQIFNLFLFMVFMGYGCMDDESLWQSGNNDKPANSEGVFILNEGNMGSSNASLFYYDPLTMEIFEDVFFESNNSYLGDVAQSMAVKDSLGYIVLNNSGRIYVINIHTFELQGKITGFISPRYIHFVNDNKAYVSDLYSKSIAVVDLHALEITGYINIHNSASVFNQHSSEKMVQLGDYVFTNSWNYDNKILVIDTKTDQWIDSIEVFIQPKSMVTDKYEKLWVLTDGGFEGNPYGHERPALMRIDAQTHTIEKVFRFDLDHFPRDMTINSTGDTLYFVNNHVYRHAVLAETAPEVFIPSPYENANYGGFYSIGVDPVSSEVYVADAIDHSQPGIVYRYSAHGAPIDTMRVGIIPGSFYFKKNQSTAANQ